MADTTLISSVSATAADEDTPDTDDLYESFEEAAGVGSRLAPRLSIPALATSEERAAVREAVWAATQGKGVPGLGGHGYIVRAVERIPLSQIAPNPHHVRQWSIADPHVQTLATSMTEGPFKQIDPLIVTPLLADDPLLVEYGYRVMAVDGHGQLAAASATHAHDLDCLVVVSETTGQPLTTFEALYYWLTRTISRKPASKMQIALAFLRMRAFWEEMNQVAGSSAPFLNKTLIARNLQTSRQVVIFADRVARQPEPILDALREGVLQESHVLRLVQECPDERERLLVARALIQENRTRLAQGRKLVGVRAIPARAAELLQLPAAGQSSASDSNAAALPLTENGWVQVDRLAATHVARTVHAGQDEVDPTVALAAVLVDAGALLATLKATDALPTWPHVRALHRLLSQPDLVAHVQDRLTAEGL